MIETLPLLSSDWRLWDWAQSNGNATVAQMAAAYEAIVNQGMCADFSRLVWNDLVDMTANAIGAAGLTWDSTYGSANDCKISSSLGVLTASAFNGVAQNIYNFGFVRWRWSINKDSPGYVGRNEFRGYSEYKENCDLLYGWYIIELALKLNRMLEVLKDEADFSEFERIMQVLSYQNSNVAAGAAAALNYINEADSIGRVSLATARVLEQNASVSGYSYQKGILIPRMPNMFEAKMQTSSEVKAVAERLQTQAMQYAGNTQSLTNTVLTELVFVGYLRHLLPSVTKVRASIEASNILFLNAVQRAESKLFSKLTASNIWLMQSHSHGDTYVKPDLIRLESLRIETKSRVNSFASPNMNLMDRKPMRGLGIVESMGESMLQYLVPQYMKWDKFSLSYPQAKANAVMPYLLTVEALGESCVKSKSNVFPSVVFTEIEKSISSVAAMVRAVQLKRIEAVAAGETTSNGSGIRCLNAIRMNAQEKAWSETDAKVEKGIPMLMNADGKAQSAGMGQPNVMPRKLLSTREFSCGDSNASVAAVGASVLKAIVEAASKVVAALSFYQNVVEWTDPVRNGNNLFITHAWNSWRDGKETFIDIAKFYVPIRENGDLYIRSAYLSYADGDKGFIDMSVYYEPVRTENDLHIKGAQVAYSDGNEGFVDMDVYYEPKQTGKNLYLRSAGSLKGVIDNG